MVTGVVTLSARLTGDNTGNDAIVDHADHGSTTLAHLVLWRLGPSVPTKPLPERFDGLRCLTLCTATRTPRRVWSQDCLTRLMLEGSEKEGSTPWPESTSESISST